MIVKLNAAKWYSTIGTIAKLHSVILAKEMNPLKINYPKLCAKKTLNLEKVLKRVGYLD